jgi:solute carrier family 25, member 33/36
VVKTQLQSSIVSVSAGGSLVGARGHPITIAKNILERDGPSGFFRGLPPTLIGIIPSRSAYFYAYQRCKTLLASNPYFSIPQLSEGSPINAMVSGLMAGIVSNTITNPIWMIKTRMTILADTAAGQQTYRGYGDVVWSIYKQEGIKGFYKGIQASYWGCAEGAVQFLIYEQLKTRLLRRKRNQLIANGQGSSISTIDLSLSTYFWSAALSKMLASICTYPHEVARTRIREQARMGVFKYKHMWQTIALIAKEEGRQGLYSGMGIHLLKVVPNSALMFVTYEIVRGWLSEFTVIE